MSLLATGSEKKKKKKKNKKKKKKKKKKKFPEGGEIPVRAWRLVAKCQHRGGCE